jgi:O-antigen biosynthesis protein WbqP
MKRFFDFVFSIILLVLFFPILTFIYLVILLLYHVNPIYLSKRSGQFSKNFLMPKFVTMKKNTPQVATHLLKNPNKYVTTFGKFLRKTSLDELPQLYSVLNGKMSIVGPRPALYNQDYLIKKRNFFKIDKLKPGITGYAQINGRDNISIKEKIKLDYFYLKNNSIKLDIKIILLTISKIINIKNISH